MGTVTRKYPSDKKNQVCSSDESIWDYTESMTKDGPELLDELIDETYEKMHCPGKTAGKTVGRALKMIASITNSKRALELGMFSGYTALSIAEGLTDDGEVITIEASPLACGMAKKYFERSEYGHKIKVLEGMCMDMLPAVEGMFDLVFIDIDKRNYLNYFKMILPQVEVGGLIIVDNALWMGNVMNPESELDKSVAALNEFILKHPDLENVFFIARDGLNIVRKLR